ncbi:MAG: tannase/feruloyl esterase family alpha/beta hydrolase [Rhizobacter sp.]|nr:tannase/feruloyl esterase family alpha/beta hydrolase [Rhizobacter sp.]
MKARTNWNRLMRATAVALGLIVLAGAASAHGGGRDDDDDDDDRHDRRGRPGQCEALTGRTLSGAQLGTAEIVAATASAPAYCRVSGLIAPKLNFELRLPLRWNRKLHYGGGGGYNGSIPPATVAALRQGYAQVSSDSGHQGSGLDASFVVGDPQAAALFGSLSVPTVMAVALDIVRLHYGKRVKRSYFEGCSNGGREALMNVQRFPTLFDGVISRAPAYNWVGIMGAFNRTAKALAAPGGAMSAAKVATLSNAVLAACDAQDGVADGVVSNPQACSFDPATLRCAGGADTDDACLSDAQLAVVGSWTAPASFVGGTYHNAGWPLSGNENVNGAWNVWTSGVPSLQFLFQDTTVKHYLANDPLANSLTYDYGSNPAALARMAGLNDATNPNLHPFLGAGGKLILWHGGNDSALSVNATTEYYRQVVAAIGGRANADQFLRYYIAPGVNHCAGGPGADSADLLSALDAWVSKRRAPGTLKANRFDPATGVKLLSRPLCEYPAYPRYDGRGDVNTAKNFSCTEP